VAGLHHPFSSQGLLDPYPALAAYRRINPAFRDRGMNMWLLTGYDLCRAALRDPAFSAAAGQAQRARDDALPVSMLNTDGGRHHRLRTPAAGAFSARAITRMSDDLELVALELLDRLASAEVDVVTDIAAPYTEKVLGRLLGLEPEHWTELGRLARSAAANLNPMVRGEEAARARHASEQLTTFLRKHSKRLRSGECPRDLAGLSITADLDEAERLGIFSLTVIGGYEPLAAGISTTLNMLLQQPAVLEELRAQPELMAGAVDESLRLESPIPFTARVCTTDFSDGRSELPAGAAVLVMVGAANRDPRVFDDPDTFDLHRSPNPHLALGGAAHFCLGAPLVRQSTAILLNAILAGHPQLAGTEPPAWRKSMVPRGLARLPIRW